MTGTIPQSPALAEASPESLAELMGTSPEDESRFAAAVPKIVAELRAMRQRFLQSEAEKAARPKAPKGTRSAKEMLATTTMPELDIDF